MENLTSIEYVDQLAVLISGSRVKQMLGVPKLPSGTGEAEAPPIFHFLVDWGISNRVMTVCLTQLPQTLVIGPEPAHRRTEAREICSSWPVTSISRNG